MKKSANCCWLSSLGADSISGVCLEIEKLLVKLSLKRGKLSCEC